MENFISKKIKKLSPSINASIAASAKKMKESDINIIDLSIGEPFFKTPHYIQEAAKAAIDSNRYFGYPPIGGYKDLREAIAKKIVDRNKIKCNYENIVVCNGVKEALSLILTVILDPGDEVIVFTPFWANYKPMINLNQGVVVPITNSIENNFIPSLDTLKNAISCKTKAILFSNPSNPTGYVLDEKYLRNLAEILADHKSIIVISDEIYEYLNFQGNHFSIGAIELIADRVVTINGFSKAYAMTGWRIGYLVGHSTLAKECIRVQAQTTSGVSGISQRAAIAALNGELSIVGEMLNVYMKNAEYVYDILTTHTKFKAHKPLGAFYLFLDISAYLNLSDINKTVLIKDDADLARFILNRAKVYLFPSIDMGINNYLRLSVASSFEQLNIACWRIIDVLKELN